MSTKSTTMTFEQALTKFVSATKNSQRLALICSQMAINHFAQHNDVIYCQRFLDAMPQNYLRKQAFVAWLREFSPIAMEDGKFKMDKSPEAVAFNVEGAMAKPFWDFKPEAAIVDFGQEDIIEQLNRTIKRFENSEKYHARDDATKALLSRAKTVVSSLSTTTAAVAVSA